MIENESWGTCLVRSLQFLKTNCHKIVKIKNTTKMSLSLIVFVKNKVIVINVLL